jgi:hypothetical protein
MENSTEVKRVSSEQLSRMSTQERMMVLSQELDNMLSTDKVDPNELKGDGYKMPSEYNYGNDGAYFITEFQLMDFGFRGLPHVMD